MTKTDPQVLRDRIHQANLQDAARCSFKAIDAIQGDPQDLQVIAAAVLFASLCDRYGLSPSDTYTCIDNMVNAAEGVRPEFQAIKNYMEEKLA